MATNTLRLRNKFGQGIDILCGATTDEPVSPRTTIPSPHDIPLWQLQDLSLQLRQRYPLRSPIQLPPLGEQRACAPELRRRTHWDPNPRNDGDPFAGVAGVGVPERGRGEQTAHVRRGLLSSSSLSASARDYYYHMGKDRRHSYHDGLMMRPRDGRQTWPPSPQPFCCGSCEGINAVDPASPSTLRDALPEYGYPPSRNPSFSSMGPRSMYPDLMQFEPETGHFDGYPKPPQAPLARCPGTLPAPPTAPSHVHQYHEPPQHCPEPQMAPYALTQEYIAFAPPPVAIVTVSGKKRYHCRYADAVSCEKTFTTSGHASRHSKIHTCEKHFQCTFAGCPKKFIRNDNMKQHLETHFKDSRPPRPVQRKRWNDALTLLSRDYGIQVIKPE